MKVERAKANAFCYNRTIEKVSPNPFKGHFEVLNYKMVRPTTEEAFKHSYKAPEGYKVTFTRKEIFDIYEKKHGKIAPNSYSYYMPTEEFIKELIALKLLPKEDYYYTKESYVGLRELFHYPDEHETSIMIYLKSDFTELPFTKKQLEVQELINKREKMEKFNNLVVGDDVVKLLNDKGYKVYKETRGNNYISFNSVAGYNKLIKEAIEYYLNNIVLKELGCKMTMPKQKPTHGFKYTDILCYIGDLELVLNKGEQ